MAAVTLPTFEQLKKNCPTGSGFAKVKADIGGGYPDLAIASVTKTAAGYDLQVQAKGTKPVPVDLTLTFADNTTQKIHRSIAVWETGATSVIVTVPTKQLLKRAALGSTLVPDSFPKDNVWEGK